MSERNLIGVCGIYCGACLIYRAYKDKDQKLVQQLARYGLSKEQIHCEGCVSNNLSPTCEKCSFRDCAKQKGFTFCFECADQPCAMIVDLAEKRSKTDHLPHLRLCLNNLNTLKREGIPEWLRQQEDRWKCAKCGKKLYWYSQSCPECGTEFHDAADEARSLSKL
jgi:hypothetical protein